MNRMYIVTRQDLVPGYQAVQACHAAVMLGKDEKANWDGHIILLSVKNLNSLHYAYKNVMTFNPKAFYEPDLDHEMTAFVVMLNETRRNALKDEQLALKTSTSFVSWLRGKVRKRFR